MRWSRVAKTTLLLICALGATSCGDGRPERVPVSGQVLIDGQPLKFGNVSFVAPGDRGSSGKLDQDGRFTLTCFEPNDGAVLGMHKVLVNACEPIGFTKVKWHAPNKYARINSSGLKQEITGPTDSIVIKLTWSGGKPFFEGYDGKPGDSEGGRPRGSAAK